MNTLAFLALEWIDNNPEATNEHKSQAVDNVPADQWPMHWKELSAHCRYRIECDTPRRRGTRLCIEVGKPAGRCLKQSPDGMGGRYLISGGDPVAYGTCKRSKCWQCNRNRQHPAQE